MSRVMYFSYCRRSAMLCIVAAVLSGVLVTSASATLIYYDSFDYPSTPGTQKLAGNTNADFGKTWTLAQTSNNVNITSGNLTYPGFPTPDPNSNSATALRGTGTIGNHGIVRVDLPGEPYTSGSIFFSMLLKATGWVNLSHPLNNNNLGGGWLAGFSTGAGADTATGPTDFAYELRTLRHTPPDAQNGETLPQRYHLGVIKQGTTGGTGTQTARSWDMSQTFGWSSGGDDDVVFVVGEYKFNTGSNTDDEARLWINPTPGDESVWNNPTIVSPAGADDAVGGIRSFYFAANTFTPSPFRFDELRIGTTFASVINVPEPGTLALLIMGALCCGWRRRRVEI